MLPLPCPSGRRSFPVCRAGISAETPKETSAETSSEVPEAEPEPANDPMDEALEQYRTIIANADTYEFEASAETLSWGWKLLVTAR